MDEDFVARAARYFADACQASEHRLNNNRLDGQCTCHQVADRLEASRNDLVRTQTFDVGREAVIYSATFPDQQWSVPALMRDVRERIQDSPWISQDNAQRAIWITAALARLGEHGVPPDGLVRFGLSHLLKAQISALAVSAHAHLKVADRTRSAIPARLLRWAEVLDQCPDQSGSWPEANQNFLTRLSRAMGGDFTDRFNDWIGAASIKDIIAWNYDAEPHQDLRPEDLGFTGGPEVMEWVVDRFTKTRYTEWRRSSLYWELRFASNPAITSTESGVPMSVLLQRPAHVSVAVDAIVARASQPHVEERFIANMSLIDLHHYVIALISNDSLGQAIDLLREAISERPSVPVLRNMLGFCLIPIDPEAALKELEDCEPGELVSGLLIQLNQIAALWRIGRFVEARRLALDLQKVPTSDNKFLLWRPDRINDRPMEAWDGLGTFSAQEWVAELLDIPLASS